MATIPLPPIFLTTPRAILDSARKLIEHLRRLQDGLVKTIVPSEATFMNVLLPLAHMDNTFQMQANSLGFYRYVSDDQVLREASTKAHAVLSDFQTETYSRQDIFQLVKSVRHTNEKLDQEAALLLVSIYDQYIQNGAAIEDLEQRQRFVAIQGRLSRLRADFLENINSDEGFICLTSEEMGGVPGNILGQLEKTAEEDMFRVYLADPGDTAIMSYAKADTRRRLFIACRNRCSGNIPLLKEAVVLRLEAANLLNFPNYAALRLQGRMVKTAEAANGFLVDVREKLTPGGLDALEMLNDLKKSDTGNNGDQTRGEEDIQPSDRDFYCRLMMAQQLSLDGKQVMEYFPVQTTIPRMLTQFSNLFGLRFHEIACKNKTMYIIWHEDVQVFSVHDDDAGGGSFLGYLYLDFFHRQGKSPQAACFTLQPVSLVNTSATCTLQPNNKFQGFTKEDGTRQHPVTALLCAFFKPASNKPSLMRHFDVVNTFHERGHGIHDLISKTKYARFHGPGGVTVGFGEIPSQMLEEWCWQPSQLKYLSFHYSYLDDEMLKVWEQENVGVSRPDAEMQDVTTEAIIRARQLTFGPLFHLDQLHRGAFDLAINQVSSLEEAAALDLTETWNKLDQDFDRNGCPGTKGNNHVLGHGYTTMGHLAQSDYEAGYYVYLL